VARKLRIQFPGALYHIVNRGDRSEPIVRDDTDRERFIETLAQACQKTGWRVDAYCLLTDHFHLVVQTPEPNLVDGMKWFLGLTLHDSTVDMPPAGIFSMVDTSPRCWIPGIWGCECRRLTFSI
jgi:hypothetical protein